MSSQKKTRRLAGNVLVREGKTGRSYCVRYRAPDGHRVFEVVGREIHGYTREHAQRYLEDRLAEMRLGRWEDPRAVPAPTPSETEMTFAQAADAWLLTHGIQRREDGELDLDGCPHAASTITALLASIEFLHRRFSDPVGRDGARGSWPLTRIRPEDVDRLLIDRPGKRGQLGRNSAKKFAKTLVSILELAVERDQITRNVARGPVGRFKGEKPKQTFLTTATHVEALLNAGRVLDAERTGGVDHHEAWIALLLLGGPRISESLAVRWRDVNLAAGTLRIRGTKTENAPRVIDLLPALREALTDLRARKPDAGKDDLVFPTVRASGQGKDNARNRWFRRIKEEADDALTAAGEDPLPPLTPHGCRHTCASILPVIGWKLEEAADHLGHADPVFLFKVYRKKWSKDPEEIARLLAIVEGAPGPEIEMEIAA